MPDTLYYKDVDATLDYTVDWTNWLESDTISVSAWTLPSDLTLTSSTNTTLKATAWIAGGKRGKTYVVTNRVTTAGGRIDERSFKISVVER